MRISEVSLYMENPWRERIFVWVITCLYKNRETCLRPLVYIDHLSIVTTVGCSVVYFSDTQAPLYKDHLSIVTTVGYSVVYFSDTNAPLYKDHLSTETPITWSLEWSL